MQQPGQQRAHLPTPPVLEHQRTTDDAPQPNRPRRYRGAPQPSRRHPQIRRRHDEPPRQWSMQWHTDRAALQPGPDPLDFIHDHGQAPAPPHPSLAFGRNGLRAENLHIQLRLITHLDAKVSLDPRILPPATRRHQSDRRRRARSLPPISPRSFIPPSRTVTSTPPPCRRSRCRTSPVGSALWRVHVHPTPAQAQ